MRKLNTYIRMVKKIWILMAIFFVVVKPQNINAADIYCSNLTVNDQLKLSNTTFLTDTSRYGMGYFIVKFQVLDNDSNYYITNDSEIISTAQFIVERNNSQPQNNQVEFKIYAPLEVKDNQTRIQSYLFLSNLKTELKVGRIDRNTSATIPGTYCPIDIPITKQPLQTNPVEQTQVPNSNYTCSIAVEPNPRLTNSTSQAYFSEIRSNSREGLERIKTRTIISTNESEEYELRLITTSDNKVVKTKSLVGASIQTTINPVGVSDTYIQSLIPPNGRLNVGNYKLEIGRIGNGKGITCQSGTFSIGPTPTPTQTEDQENREQLKNICDGLRTSESPASNNQSTSEQVREKERAFNECTICVSGEKYDGVTGAYTAIGCIPTDMGTFLQKYIFGVGLGLAGAVAFFLFLWGAFTIIISQGDPQKIQQGKEIITSAIAGLLLIIFSVVILNIIGVELLGIPTFGGKG